MVKVKSDLYNLQKIIDAEFSFNIPIYQRLYVWTDEQVKTLFEDLYSAWRSKKDMYYVGGVITVPNEQQRNLYDLVDGQQRFTTLWLLSNELKGDLLSFTNIGKVLRLKFSIRENVENYFNNIGVKSKKNSEGNNEFGDLVKISKARKLLRTLIDENLKSGNELKEFTQFVLRNVKLVISQVPVNTDLNKLFETLNNRGEQLQQHEILKARLLKYIRNNKTRHRFSKLWNVCSEMDEYLERTIAKEIGSAKDVADCHDHQGFLLTKIHELLKRSEIEKKKSIDLKRILAQKTDFTDKSEAYKSELDFHPNANDDEFEPVRSILTFPQLLLHTLRIYLFKNELDDIERINEKDLLKTFDEQLLKKEMLDESKVKEFIELLFQVREVFDKYIIKWVAVNEDKEEHLIKIIRKQNQRKGGKTWYLRREKKEGLNSFALLQSILYHSQQNTTQYWLTPLLFWLVDDEEPIRFDDAYEWLRKLDNTILSSGKEDVSLPERTWESMNDYLDHEPTLSVFEEEGNIKKLGTRFPHYWFYKIEFVLWYYRKDLNKADDWNDYKMTARNSIEHIGPQNPRYTEDKVCNNMLDAMGNLVLVTRSINSEYSDMSFTRKQGIYKDKRSKGSIDSLKSDLIYQHENWNDDVAKQHQQQVLKLLKRYFDENSVK